ncbi:hypothetical protein FNB15_05900 [Ferrovibrio terrae]|uniref:Uncharacterized protein n=1 Tax=Ferrovibrio terrae TaxID=2594003 RepID=A0A516GZ89_9PROT|nr:hypothetical protein [Ferrovibrio terrae]QDO96836.1 hypothetical protein FNB15_05900 [Ferrovibrio terrae]
MSEKPQEKIIDAEAEPIGNAGSGSGRNLRIVLYLLAAVVLSVAIAIGYHFAVSGRLDDLLGSVAPSSAAPRAGEPAPTPAPSAAAPTPAPSVVPMSTRDARLDQLESRFSSLTASLERLQQLPAANAVDPQKLHEIEQQVLALRAALETSATQRAALQSQVAELQGRMTALSEARLSSLREPLVQLIGWSELREHARRGESFPREATALGAYAEAQGGNLKTAFAGLQPFAEQPAPSTAALAARFAALAEQQRATPATADATAATDKAWWQRAVDKLSGLVSIRRTGAPDAATIDGRLDLAAAALAQGDLKAAVADLDGLTLVGPLTEWREQAQARLKLDAALDAYGAALRAHLTVQ